MHTFSHRVVYKFNEKSTGVFEKVSRPLKCHSNFLGGHIHVYIYIKDTSPDHIYPARAARAG